MFQNSLLRARAQQNHIIKSLPIAIVQSGENNNTQSVLNVNLSVVPTVGNFLIAIINYQNTNSRTPTVDGGTNGWNSFLGPIARGTSSVELFYRKVLTGGSNSTSIAFATSAGQSATILEIQGVIGNITSVVSINTGPYPQTIVIPAGVSNALPIIFNTWGSNATYTPVAPSGWSLINAVTSGIDPQGCFYSNALSNGSAISVTPNGSISNSLYPQSGGFLIS